MYDASRNSQIYTNARVATLSGDIGYGLIEGALVISQGLIDFIGAWEDLPEKYRQAPQTNLGGRVITPGLIDCHTHLVYGGSRANEFEMRLEGKSYEEISKAGGGIVSTVGATRDASEEELLLQTHARLGKLLAEGVSTVEIKSGYGLDMETELRMLTVARKLEQQRPVRIKTTFLGAHAVPKGMSSDAYIDDICIPALRKAHSENLVDAVDGFCENIGFTTEQITRVFNTAKELGLPVKLHAEQLTDQDGAKLAASYNALSADHLEFISDAGIAAMAKSGTVATILPGAFYYLGETQKPPIRKFRAARVPMAIATDSNPGSSPMTSILLAMNMAATLFAMTPEECLRGVTVNAAKALGLDDCGTIEIGKRADLAIWDIEHPAELTYRIGDATLYHRIFEGQIC